MIDFKKLVGELGIELSDDMLNKYNLYYRFLVSENEKINLTSIVDEEGVYLKHFYDSITLVKASIFDGASICDIGAGAGFPSIPLKICMPNLKITIIDSLQKRCNFLKQLVDLLGLDDVTIVWGRAEEYKEKQFDFVTARAVARLNILNELCIPLVKIGGCFVAMKSSLVDSEIAEATKGINILGGKVSDVISFTLPMEESSRNILVVEKVKSTPLKYPRKFSLIKKLPL